MSSMQANEQTDYWCHWIIFSLPPHSNSSFQNNIQAWQYKEHHRNKIQQLFELSSINNIFYPNGSFGDNGYIDLENQPDLVPGLHCYRWSLTAEGPSSPISSKLPFGQCLPYYYYIMYFRWENGYYWTSIVLEKDISFDPRHFTASTLFAKTYQRFYIISKDCDLVLNADIRSLVLLYLDIWHDLLCLVE